MTHNHFTPAIVRTTGTDPMIMVAEQWGDSTEALLEAGAIQVSRFEILSRLSQTEPVSERRLAGEITDFAPIRIIGRIGNIEVALTVDFPTSLERYRIHAQDGWSYGVFDAKRFDRIEIRECGEWVCVDGGTP